MPCVPCVPFRLPRGRAAASRASVRVQASQPAAGPSTRPLTEVTTSDASSSIEPSTGGSGVRRRRRQPPPLSSSPSLPASAAAVLLPPSLACSDAFPAACSAAVCWPLPLLLPARARQRPARVRVSGGRRAAAVGWGGRCRCLQGPGAAAAIAERSMAPRDLSSGSGSRREHVPLEINGSAFSGQLLGRLQATVHDWQVASANSSSCRGTMHERPPMQTTRHLAASKPEPDDLPDLSVSLQLLQCSRIRACLKWEWVCSAEWLNSKK